MAYLSLYRRHRPRTFADITGQEHVTRTLGNALLKGRPAHAYLFCGPRGTGKTTVAKILARALNCDHYPAAEPCGRCAACSNIAAGVSMDVIEMDAASNRGIDEIRELRDRTRYATAENRYKVYIIDEAHMLTTEAFNAFLKTLEEPPDKVVFIMATTDPSRLPSTIVSRCQRFDFHLLTVEQISGRLEHVLKEENQKFSTEAVRLIARLAEGSLRDALGILEQCSVYSEEEITAEQVRLVTGATKVEVIEELLKAVINNDPAAGFDIIEQVVYGGRDLQLLVRDLTFVFSRLLLREGGGEKKTKNGHGFEKITAGIENALSAGQILDAVELLYEVGGELRYAHFPHFILEVSFLRLLRVLHGKKQSLPDIRNGEPAEVVCGEQARGQQVNSEQTTGEGKPFKVDDYSGNKPDHTGKSSSKEPGNGEKHTRGTEETSSSPSDPYSRLSDSWSRVLDEVKKRKKTTAAWLEPANLEDFRGMRVCLSYAPEYEIHKRRIMEESHRLIVEEVISNLLNMDIDISATVNEVNKGSEVSGAGQESVGSVNEAGKTYQVAEISKGSVEKTVSESDEDQILIKNHNNHTIKKKAVNAEDALRLFGGELIESD